MKDEIVRHRFSKAVVLRVLDGVAARIAKEQMFDRCNGTSQLNPKSREFDEHIRRAVEYGRMRAFEQFAEWIEEGFAFNKEAKDTSLEQRVQQMRCDGAI